MRRTNLVFLALILIFSILVFSFLGDEFSGVMGFSVQEKVNLDDVVGNSINYKGSNYVNYKEFDELVLNSLRSKEDIKKDFKENWDLIRYAIDEVSKFSIIDDPYKFLGLLYVESNYFSDNSIRCENSYEKKFNFLSKFCSSSQDCNSFVYCSSCDSLGGSDCSLDSKDGCKFHRISCSYGPGQIMYSTAISEGFKGDSIELLDSFGGTNEAIKHLVWLMDNYESFSTNDAILAYNTGQGNIIKAMDRAGSKDFNYYVSYLPWPKHSALYLGKVLAYADIFRELDEGNGASVSGSVVIPSLSSLAHSHSLVAPRFSFDIFNFSIYDSFYDVVKKLESCDDPIQRKACLSSFISGQKEFNFNMEESCVNNANLRFKDILIRLENCIDGLNPPCCCYSDLKAGEKLIIKKGDSEGDFSSVEAFLEGEWFYGSVDASLARSELFFEEGSCVGSNGISLDSINGVDCRFFPKSQYRFCAVSKKNFFDGDSFKPLNFKFALVFDDVKSEAPSISDFTIYKGKGMLVSENEEGIFTAVSEVSS